MFTETGKRVFNSTITDNGRFNFGRVSEIGRFSFVIYASILLQDTSESLENILNINARALVSDNGTVSESLIINNYLK